MIDLKVLVIPDVHLKPRMFDRADEIMKSGAAEKAVSLMDIPDDWNCQFNIDLYIETFNRAVSFSQEHPDTLWCYGNHDLSYVWECFETGYSAAAGPTVNTMIRRLQESLPDLNRLAYVHRIDDVIFSHGGISDNFVKSNTLREEDDEIDTVLERINSLDKSIMWKSNSPIWFRPQYSSAKVFAEENMLQVVGHTPVKEIYRKNSVISCDVFSTYSNGRPIGTQEFLIIDTETWNYFGIK